MREGASGQAGLVVRGWLARAYYILLDIWLAGASCILLDIYRVRISNRIHEAPSSHHPHHRTNLAASPLLHASHSLHARGLFPFACTRN
jgi:hypothetical protein